LFQVSLIYDLVEGAKPAVHQDVFRDFLSSQHTATSHKNQHQPASISFLDYSP
jgi:hypothetical protein